MIEFLVEDMDKEFARLREYVPEFIQEPTTMPWGNRSLLFHDPDGNVVNLFTPVTPEAISKFKMECKTAFASPIALFIHKEQSGTAFAR